MNRLGCFETFGMHLELPHALASVIKSGISLRSLKQLRDLLVNECISLRILRVPCCRTFCRCVTHEDLNL